jgi:hypothetical protein
MHKTNTILAHIISAVTHPMLLVTYMLLFLLSVNPFMFGVRSLEGYMPYVLMVFFSTVLIPAVSVFMMRSLGFVTSIQLKKRTDRVGPLIVAIVFYSWLLVNFYNNPAVPKLFLLILFGATIALGLSFMVNVFVKLSMHGVGLGGLIAGVLFMMAMPEYTILELRLSPDRSLVFPIYLFLFFVLLITGLAGTSRLLLGLHTLKEWMIGMSVGIIAEVIAYYILF